MLHESTIQDEVYIFPWESLVMLKILSFKSSISLALLFCSVYFIEIVIIADRQSLPLSYLENYKLKN